MATQIFNISLDWSDQQRLQGTGDKALTDEEYEKLREQLVILDLAPVSERSRQYFSKIMATSHELQVFVDMGFTPSVSRIRGLFDDQLQALGVPPMPNASQVVNVTIPNIGLFSVRRVMVLEDMCTDAVQKYLENGWRIVAVCPPNDTRRPTYILGHMDTSPEYF